MRLIALPPERDGTVHGGLQIEPKAGWITYWREPGNSGIPPQISVAPGSVMTLTGVRYPVPKHINDGKVDDIAYDAPVILPLTFKAEDQAAEIRATASSASARISAFPSRRRFRCRCRVRSNRGRRRKRC